MQLPATLTITRGTGCTLTLDVHNPGPAPALLEFASAQQYDFVISAPTSGDPVWAWSDDRMFGQAMSSRTLAPGEHWVITESCPLSLEGTLSVCGRIVCLTHDAVACEPLSLP